MTDTSSQKKKILVIDDERSIRRFLRSAFLGTNFDLLEAETAEEGKKLVALEKPDVVLLDLGLPDMDGVTVAQNLREWTVVPIIVISARGQETDKVKALDAGADDYLTKPFGAEELLARIRVALRHAERDASLSPEPIFEYAGLMVDLSKRLVTRDAAEIHLTPIEFQLLSILVKHAGKVVTHKQLLTEVWGAEALENTHYLRVYMGQLRQKIEHNAAKPRYLMTEPGVGYRLRCAQ